MTHRMSRQFNDSILVKVLSYHIEFELKDNFLIKTDKNVNDFMSENS